MKQRYEKYIVCPDCHIGGYDFCEKCLGAGGYTIEVFDDHSTEKNIIKDGKIKAINTKLDLIVQRGIWNETIEQKLAEYFVLLSESTYSSDVLKTLKRIIKVRKNNYGKKLLRLFQEKTKKLEAIKLTVTKKSITVHGDEKYFSNGEGNSIVYKLTSSQFVSFSSQLLKGFIDNLEFNSVLKFENYEALSHYKKDDIEAISQSDCILFDVESDSQEQKFVIKKAKIKRVCVSYINMLHEKNINGWYYIQ